MNNINHTFRSIIALQVALENLEQIENISPFKKKNALRLEQTIEWLDKVVSQITSDCNLKESENYNYICQDIRNKLNKINVIHESSSSKD